MKLSWAPFDVIEISLDMPKTPNLPRPRAVNTLEGVGDRMRAAAFAEFQATRAFAWAAEHFLDAPERLRQDWRNLAVDEARHYQWIMTRMQELAIDPAGRPVSNRLWVSLQACENAEKFAHYIANSEERGRKSGLLFAEAIKTQDPITSEIFARIAQEEIDHVALAFRFYARENVQPEHQIQ